MQSLWMLLASFLFSVMAVCVKLCADQIGTFTMVFYRGLIGVIVLGGWAIYSGRSLKTTCLISHMKRSGTGTIAMAMWMYSLLFLPLSTGTTINYTSPLWMAAILVITALIKKDNAQWKLAGTAFLGFFGVIQVLQPEFRSGDLTPALIGLGSGLLSAIAYIQIKELSRMNEPEWRVVFYFSLCNLVFGLVGHWLFEKPDIYTAQSLSYVLIGCGSATLAQIAMTRSFGAGNLLLSSILSFSGIIFASIFGIVLFNEPTSLETYLGISIIIVAGVLASILTKRAKKA